MRNLVNRKNSLSRNLTIDFIRGIAILLVVLGHNIQYGSGNVFYQSESYFENFLFKFIYSFHMPLFALISGYLFFWTMRKTVNDVLKSRLIALILPIFCWVTMENIGKGVLLASRNQFVLETFIHNYVSSFLYEFWFLWAIFWCSMIVLIVENISLEFKNVLGGGIYVLIWILSFWVPRKLNIHMYAFMYPYFIAGFLFNKFDGIALYRKYVKKDWKVFAILVVAFTVLFAFYNYDSFIYTTAISVLGENGFSQIGIDLYRWEIGFIGSFMVILACKMISGRWSSVEIKVIAYLGQISLGVYILNSYFNLYVVRKITSSIQPSLFIWIVETILSMSLYIIFIEVIRRIPLANKLLLGGRKIKAN